MSGDSLYFFRLNLINGKPTPCFIFGGNPKYSYNMSCNFNEWFFSIIGLIILNHQNTKLAVVVDKNLFRLLKGSENWLFIANNHCSVDIKQKSIYLNCNELMDSFIQLLLYNLLKLSGTKEFDHILESVINSNNAPIEHYYLQYLNEAEIDYKFEARCTLEEAIDNSKLHDGLFTKAKNTRLLRAGSIINLESEFEKYKQLGLIYFFNTICSYEKRDEINRLILSCNVKKIIEPKNQSNLEFFKKYLNAKYDHRVIY